MDSRETAALARGFFHALGQGDTQWIAEHFSDYGSYSVQGHVAGPNTITRDKLENVISHVMKQFPTGLDFSVQSVLSNDEGAAAEVEILGMHESGELVDTHYLFLFAFADGKIDHIKEYAASDALSRHIVSEEFWGHN